MLSAGEAWLEWTPEALGIHQSTQKPLLWHNGAASINEQCMTLMERVGQECVAFLTWVADEKLVEYLPGVSMFRRKSNWGQRLSSELKALSLNGI